MSQLVMACRTERCKLYTTLGLTFSSKLFFFFFLVFQDVMDFSQLSSIRGRRGKKKADRKQMLFAEAVREERQQN